MVVSTPPVDPGIAESTLWDSLVRNLDPFQLLVFGSTLVVVGLVLFTARRLFDHRNRGQSFARQVTMGGLVLGSLLAVVLTLPIDAGIKQSLLGVIGIVLSAVIALSSTSIMGNALAGLMLRSLRKFKTGDYIRCGEHFGCVTERGLVHTQIQTEDSDLVTLPNLYLVTNPLTTVDGTSTVISATVSLGYDVPHAEVSQVLLDAARTVGLDPPFVRIMALGDFSITYRVAGVLKPAKELDLSRTRLRRAMLDALHGAGIEIVSPTFMNQRQVSRPTLPPAAPVQALAEAADDEGSDNIVFAKALVALSLEAMGEEREQVESEIADLDKRMRAPDEDRDRLQRILAIKQRRLERLSAQMAAQQARDAAKS